MEPLDDASTARCMEEMGLPAAFGRRGAGRRERTRKRRRRAARSSDESGTSSVKRSRGGGGAEVGSAAEPDAECGSSQFTPCVGGEGGGRPGHKCANTAAPSDAKIRSPRDAGHPAGAGSGVGSAVCPSADGAGCPNVPGKERACSARTVLPHTQRVDGYVDKHGAPLWFKSAPRPDTLPPLLGQLGTHRAATVFCDSGLVQDLRQAKDDFEGMDRRTFIRARYAANPFEAVGSGPFLNRSAMKLANLDHVFNITTACGRAREMAAPARPLTFVDLCGGPGGFTEYLLRCCDARGWGMSLTEEAGANGCDWRLDHVSGVVRGGSSETARPAARDPSDTPTTTGSERAWRFKQVLGQDGTGDIYNEDNIAVLAKEVRLEASDGADLAVADGGFLAARDRHDQELVVYRLILCECAAMLATLRPGGLFLCKLFDTMFPCTVALVYIMAQTFDAVTIVKPPTSRPASAERYLLCRGLRGDLASNKALFDALLAENARVGRANDGVPAADHSLLSLDTLTTVEFAAFVNETNNRLARRQIDACRAITSAAKRQRSRSRSGARRRDPRAKGGTAGDGVRAHTTQERGGTRGGGAGKASATSARRGQQAVNIEECVACWSRGKR